MHGKIYTMNKKTIAYAVTLLAPFLVVWVAYIMTGFVFSTQDVFTSPVFWIMSVIYWVTFMWIPCSVIEQEL
jgi:hypothetical protein